MSAAIFERDRTPGGGLPSPEYAEVLGSNDIPAIAISAWAQTQRTNMERAREHAPAVRDTMYAMMGMGLPVGAYHAALLHDMPEEAANEIGSNAKNALRDYARSEYIDPRLFGYVCSVLASFIAVERFGEEQRAVFEHKDKRLQDIIRGTIRSEDSVPTSFWLEDAAITDPERMVSLLEVITPAGVPLRGAELFQNIVQPSEKPAGELRDLNELESTIAPLMYWLGYDATEMTMNGIAKEHRLKRANLGGFVDMAEAAIDGLGEDEEIIEDVGSLLSSLGTGFDFQSVIGEVPGVGPVLFCDIAQGLGGQLGDLTEGGVRGKLRRKSLGNTAFKLYRNGGIVPADLVGLTIIPKNKEQVLAYYADLSSKLKKMHSEDAGVELVSSPSRDVPFSVKGDEDFFQEVLDTTGMSESEVDSDPAPYSSVKVTFMLNGRPTELQVLTELDRQNSKYDAATHVGQGARKKDGVSQPAPFDPKFMRRIREFRQDMRSTAINPGSIEGAEAIAKICRRQLGT